MSSQVKSQTNRSFQKSWQAYESIKTLYVFLCEFDVTTGRILKLPFQFDILKLNVNAASAFGPCAFILCVFSFLKTEKQRNNLNLSFLANIEN